MNKRKLRNHPETANIIPWDFQARHLVNISRGNAGLLNFSLFGFYFFRKRRKPDTKVLAYVSRASAELQALLHKQLNALLKSSLFISFIFCQPNKDSSLTFYQDSLCYLKYHFVLLQFS